MSDTKMKAFEVDLTMQATILFHDEAKAQHFFIDDDAPDAWKNYFWTRNDLGELAQDIIKGIYYSKALGRAFCEGFGEFKFSYKRFVWEINSTEFGDISVDLTELDHEFPPLDVSEKIEKVFAHLRK